MRRVNSILKTKTNLLRQLTTIGAALGAVLVLSAPAGATSLTTVLYSYNFANVHGSGSGPWTVNNLATSSPYSGATLTLDSQTNGAEDTCPGTGCHWLSTINDGASGVSFDGGTFSGTDTDSTAYYQPNATTQKINIAATQAAATETQFVYYQVTNNGCTSSTDNTPNISEIGKGASTSTGQIKLQLSDCINGNPQYVGCRIAGLNNQTFAMQPFYANGSSSYALEANDEYNVRCAEVPVMTGGAATGTTLTLRVVNVTDSSQVIPNTIETVSYNGGTEGIGTIKTTAPVSVGNKWTNQSPNTNQFNGQVNRNVYCEGDTAGTATLTDMFNCLTTGMGM